MHFIFFAAVAVGAAVASREWQDTPVTTQIWQMMSMGEEAADTFRTFLITNPKAIFERSGDGRGALFWAWEFGNTQALLTLKASQVDVFSEDVKDATGSSAPGLCQADDNCDYEAIVEMLQDDAAVELEKELIIEKVRELREASEGDLDDMDEESEEEEEEEGEANNTQDDDDMDDDDEVYGGSTDVDDEILPDDADDDEI